MRNRDKLRLFVDGGEQRLQRQCHAVRGSKPAYASSLPLESVIDVVVGREVQAVRDELVPGSIPIEAGSHDRLTYRNVLVHDDLASTSSDYRADEIADGHGHFPPPFFPGTNTARRPGFGELLQCVGGAARHGSE